MVDTTIPETISRQGMIQICSSNAGHKYSSVDPFRFKFHAIHTTQQYQPNYIHASLQSCNHFSIYDLTVFQCDCHVSFFIFRARPFDKLIVSVRSTPQLTTTIHQQYGRFRSGILLRNSFHFHSCLLIQGQKFANGYQCQSDLGYRTGPLTMIRFEFYWQQELHKLCRFRGLDQCRCRYK